MRDRAAPQRTSLEAGLKYLVVGSVGSATLLYGLALIYGATGAMDFAAIAAAIGERGELGDPLLLTGIALTITGLAFKASVAPFHQWTPDVYQGAPTPITAFMAVATKAAAFASKGEIVRGRSPHVRAVRGGNGRPRSRDPLPPSLSTLTLTLARLTFVAETILVVHHARGFGHPR